MTRQLPNNSWSKSRRGQMPCSSLTSMATSWAPLSFKTDSSISCANGSLLARNGERKWAWAHRKAKCKCLTNNHLRLIKTKEIPIDPLKMWSPKYGIKHSLTGRAKNSQFRRGGCNPSRLVRNTLKAMSRRMPSVMKPTIRSFRICRHWLWT